MTQIFVGLLVVIAIFITVVVMQPSDFRITRSLLIAAPTSTIFPHVNNLHKFNEWNPWAKIDPASKSTFEGAAEGEGSILRWEGNNQVGSGIMTNTQSKPNEYIQFKMEFLKPMQATNIAEFTFQADGNSTLVTWSMYGKNSFVGKAVSLFMNCEKMVGGQFEKGLANLQAIVEKP